MGDTVPERVIAFDWDGTLTNKGDTSTGRAGITYDLAPVMCAMAAGHRVAIMTADPDNLQRIPAILAQYGITSYADVTMQCKMPRMVGEVLVTNRKVLADVYVDDRAMRWQFGMDETIIERMINGTG